MIIVLPWLLLAGLLLVVWLIYCYSANASIIDIVWALGIAWCGVGYTWLNGELSWRSIIVVFLLGIWALRLSLFLWWTRVKPKHADPRYEDLSQNWRNKRLGFLLNYQFQGILMALMAIPFYWNTVANYWTLPDMLGFVLYIIGLVGETVADYQLYQFKKRTKPKHSVIMNQGLWRYSRHPNYFFEWLIWLAFAILALSVSWGWLAFVSPLLLLAIMLGITLPMTEKQALKSKGQAFEQYQNQTSAFIPWPPKT